MSEITIGPVFELLKDQEHWTKGRFAINKYGATVDENAPTAVKWCVIGAIWRCYYLPAERMQAIARMAAAIQGAFPGLYDVRYPDVTLVNNFNESPQTSHQQLVEALTYAQI